MYMYSWKCLIFFPSFAERFRPTFAYSPPHRLWLPRWRQTMTGGLWCKPTSHSSSRYKPEWGGLERDDRTRRDSSSSPHVKRTLSSYRLPGKDLNRGRLTRRDSITSQSKQLLPWRWALVSDSEHAFNWQFNCSCTYIMYVFLIC